MSRFDRIFREFVLFLAKPYTHDQTQNVCEQHTRGARDASDVRKQARNLKKNVRVSTLENEREIAVEMREQSLWNNHMRNVLAGPPGFEPR